MNDTERDFLDLALSCQVLKLGEFTLKSGRISPYFFNLGAISTGAALQRLARAYARRLLDSGLAFDQLFGPAYKGIPLVAAVAIALAELGCDVPFSYNRKETKNHGEGGSLVGAPLRGRVVIVDDVITAGTAVREAIDLIRATGAQPVGLVIALDRQERVGESQLSAVQALEQESALQVLPVARLIDVIRYLEHNDTPASTLAAMREYRKTYGVDSTPTE